MANDKELRSCKDLSLEDWASVHKAEISLLGMPSKDLLLNNI